MSYKHLSLVLLVFLVPLVPLVRISNRIAIEKIPMFRFADKRHILASDLKPEVFVGKLNSSHPFKGWDFVGMGHGCVPYALCPKRPRVHSSHPYKEWDSSPFSLK